MLDRNLYTRVVDPECWLPDGRVVDDLRAALRCARGRTPDSLTAARAAVAEWATHETRGFRALLAPAATAETRDLVLRRAAASCAPLALLSGAWLHGLTSPGNADDPVALDLLALYADDIGVGHPRSSRGSEYRVLLRRLRLSEYAGPAARLPLRQELSGAAFSVPAVLMAMARRPEDFAPELVGADLCLREIGTLPALVPVRDALPDAVDWALLDPGTSVDRSRAVAAALPVDRVLLGFGWAWDAVRRWSAGLHQRLEAVREPAHAMAELLRARAREGAVYHRGFEMEGRSLAEWLSLARHDPGPLMRVLARSRLVRPGDATRSPLVTGMIGPRGPMFRVFSAEDVAVIRRWIDSLGGPEPDLELGAEQPPSAIHLPEGSDRPVRVGRTHIGLRQAYHGLQRRALTAPLRDYALDYVRQWLDRARRGVKADGSPLPQVWPAAGLRPWLLDQHDKHAQEFEADDPADAPTRDELVDSSLQLAPLTLIDGSWLLGFTDYELASSDIGYRLFDTYWDELGNGDPALNHPRIYRELLASMGVELPPTASAEFADWAGFRDESFELPVFWLGIGRFPTTFLPEVLGLNLAMELSGVGGSYRRAHLALRHHGFSTRFVDIHNTIDNVATGHSAWAADAIDSFMAARPELDRGTGDRVWERVVVGFRSLTPPAKARPRWVKRLTGMGS
ncbi:hypothetical protein JOD54_005712 [Actinokineospora baliensis]|uniref:iron-containing redox enzyme family protein n=1 Tax=Actinokineospora baliensis TaxID=547056 RepID=UPI00195DE244|nr:iron-containing redox enzyme family protein [Actinokineospora baliensis]MBM7775508.1 hypothetical protein [Actinokineospora baliensis]